MLLRLIFFCAKKGDYIETSILTERSRTKEKLQKGPLDPGSDDGQNGPAARRCCCSSSLGTETDPQQPGSRRTTGNRTPWTANGAVKLRHNSFFKDNTRNRRNTDTGGGRPRIAPPKNCNRGLNGRSAAKLLRARPPERLNAAPKARSECATTSWTPPARELPDPTLWTRRIRGSPTLPPLKRPAEGEGTGESPPGKVDRLEVSQIAPDLL
jgi:hypothetical protein